MSSGAAVASAAKQKPAAFEDTEESFVDEYDELEDEPSDPVTDTLAAVSDLADTLKAQDDWEDQTAEEEESDAFINEAVAGQIR